MIVQHSIVCVVAKSSLVAYTTCVEEYSTLNPKPCSIVPCRSDFDQEGGLTRGAPKASLVASGGFWVLGQGLEISWRALMTSEQVV